MTTSNDFIRQASMFTMGGLIDPRLMPGYERPSNQSKIENVRILTLRINIRKGIINLLGKMRNEPMQG